MVTLEVTARLDVPGLPETSPLHRVMITEHGDATLLIAESMAGGGLAAFAVGSDGTARFTDFQSFTSGAPFLTSDLFEVVVLEEEAYVLHGAAQTASYGLTSSGSLSAGTIITDAGADFGLVAPTEDARTLVATTSDGSAIAAYRFDEGAEFAALAEPLRLDGISAMTVTAAGVVVVALGHGDMVQTLGLSSGGTLNPVDAIGAENGFGIRTPTALQSALVDGRDYVVLASAGSSSLSVFEVSADGTLTVTDHVLDSGETRFQNASHLEVFQSEGRTFVVASGSDDGLSLFTLLPGGRLFHLSSFASNADTSLRNVSSVTGAFNDDNLDLFAIAEGQDVVVQLSADLSEWGGVADGQASGGTLRGSDADDILILGDASQIAYGGAGADTFVFLPERANVDGFLGRVGDYDQGTDQLDLSALPFLRDVSQIEFERDGGELTLRFGEYHIVLAGSDLRDDGFSTADILNLQHVPLGPFEADFEDTGDGSAGPFIGAGGIDTLFGTTAADELRGMDGNDTLDGRQGNDTLDGGAGDDVLLGGDGADRLSGGADADVLDGGAGADELFGGTGQDRLIGAGGNDTLDGGAGFDTAVFFGSLASATITQDGDVTVISNGTGTDQLIGIEEVVFSDATLLLEDYFSTGPIMGTPGSDELNGSDLPDTIFGLAGDDTLRGFEGDDVLNAGDGTDTVNGGDGHDRIIGGASGADRRDTIYAGTGNDTIDAGYGNDLAYGQDGHDTMAGGFGADELYGQNGDDTITGSAFSDLVFGGAGDDFVNGGFGFDRINGGTGADKFYHAAAEGHGSDWVQDYASADGDVLVFGGTGAEASDFVVRLAHTASPGGERAGDDGIQEAFVNFGGQTLWALVDGAGQTEINIQIGGEVFDLLA